MTVNRHVRLFCGLVALLLATGFAAAQDAKGKPALHDDFETQVPGQVPEGWGVSWGDREDDLTTITNTQAAAGRQCLMIDRKSGTGAGGYKFRRSLPDVAEGWARLRLCVRVDGPAAEARFVIGLTERRPRSLVHVNVGLRGWGPKMYLYPSIGKTWTDNWNGKRLMAAYRPGTWHRITLHAPTKGNPAEHVYGVVEARQDDGTWQRVGTPSAVMGRAPETGYGGLTFDIYGKNRGYVLYIDEITFDTVKHLPAEFKDLQETNK